MGAFEKTEWLLVRLYLILFVRVRVRGWAGGLEGTVIIIFQEPSPAVKGGREGRMRKWEVGMWD